MPAITDVSQYFIRVINVSLFTGRCPHFCLNDPVRTRHRVVRARAAKGFLSATANRERLPLFAGSCCVGEITATTKSSPLTSAECRTAACVQCAVADCIHADLNAIALPCPAAIRCPYTGCRRRAAWKQQPVSREASVGIIRRSVAAVVTWPQAAAMWASAARVCGMTRCRAEEFGVPTVGFATVCSAAKCVA